MGTKFAEFFSDLAAPFGANEVKSRTQGGRQVKYVTARTVMNRLDEVAGPEGWSDDYQALEHGVLCRLTIRFPDGSTLAKSDAGGHAGMPDSGDDEKSGYSDAFKRAAVKFGVGRYLYRDGIPGFITTILGMSAQDLDVLTNAGQAPSQPQQPPPSRPSQPNSSAPPQGNGQARQYDNSRCPGSGKGLFAWAMTKQKDEHVEGVVEFINSFGKQMSFPARMIEWSSEEVKEAWDAYHGKS